MLIIGGHEKQDMGPVVEFLKEGKEDSGPDPLPELHIRSRLELLLQFAPRALLPGGLLVQYLRCGASILMERMSTSNELFHLIQKDDTVSKFEQVVEDRPGRFGDSIRAMAEKMVRAQSDERPPESFRKVLDIGGLPGPRRAIKNSAPGLLAPIRASGQAVATKVTVLDLDGLDNSFQEGRADRGGLDCVVSPMDVAYHPEQLLRVRCASHLPVEGVHSEASAPPRVVEIRQVQEAIALGGGPCFRDSRLGLEPRCP